jgi:hypothetical protein
LPRETINSGTDLGLVDVVSNSESDPESEEQEYEENDQFMIAQDMRGSYFDRSIELENIIELPNESGSEFSNQDFE